MRTGTKLRVDNVGNLLLTSMGISPEVVIWQTGTRCLSKYNCEIFYVLVWLTVGIFVQIFNDIRQNI